MRQHLAPTAPSPLQVHGYYAYTLPVRARALEFYFYITVTTPGSCTYTLQI
jgi:hypothetical protein